MSDEFDLYAGVDWGSEWHEVHVMTADRATVLHDRFEHSGDGLHRLAETLSKLGDPSRTTVAIELPRGPVVEGLLKQGFAVFSINPKQLDRFRDRHTVAGAKDDRLDALVLADSIRTDRHCFHRARFDDALVVELRELNRVDDDLKDQFNALCNRARALFHRYYPAMLQLSPHVSEPWIWRLFELAPTPAKARKLRPQRVEKLLGEHRIRRVKARDVVKTLRARPVEVAPGSDTAAVLHLELLVPQLRLVRAQRKALRQRIEHVLTKLSEPDGDAEGQPEEHRDAAVLRSLPGVGIKVAATMLSEAAQAIAERDHGTLRAFAGVAPITRASGKRSRVVMRRACNSRLRNATYHWARVASQCDEHWKGVYGALRKRGHSHGRALRTVSDRLLSVLVGMLKSGTLYDGSRWTPKEPDQTSAEVKAAA